jgi:YD repeat-containing protein
MKPLSSILLHRGLLVIFLILSIDMLSAQGQSDSADGEIVFHVVKTHPCTREKQNDLMMEGLKGRVKTVITEQYDNHSFKGITTDELEVTKTSRYDTMGILMETNTDYTVPKFHLSQKRKFDHQKIVTEILDGSARGYYKESKYQYDANGRLASIRSHGYMRRDGTGSNGREDFELISTYDTTGNPLEIEEIDKTTSYKYDPQGRCIESVLSINNPDESTTTTYTYGENCKVKEELRTGSYIGRTTYKYDNKDSLLLKNEWNYLVNDSIITTSYKYDDHGNQIEIKRTIDGKTNDYIYQYLYDETGNWTQRVEYNNSSEERYFIRQITYY